MEKSMKQKSDANTMVTVARVFGALPTLFFVGMAGILGIGSLFPDESEQIDIMTIYVEVLPVLLLILVAIGAYIYAFRHPTAPKSGFLLIGIGGLIFLDILLTKLIRFSPSPESLQAGLMGGAIYLVPLAIEGTLFLLAAHVSQKSPAPKDNETG
jgi:hypothetical protein